MDALAIGLGRVLELKNAVAAAVACSQEPVRRYAAADLAAVAATARRLLLLCLDHVRSRLGWRRTYVLAAPLTRDVHTRLWEHAVPGNTQRVKVLMNHAVCAELALKVLVVRGAVCPSSTAAQPLACRSGAELVQPCSVSQGLVAGAESRSWRSRGTRAGVLMRHVCGTTQYQWYWYWYNQYQYQCILVLVVYQYARHEQSCRGFAGLRGHCGGRAAVGGPGLREREAGGAAHRSRGRRARQGRRAHVAAAPGRALAQPRAGAPRPGGARVQQTRAGVCLLYSACRVSEGGRVLRKLFVERVQWAAEARGHDMRTLLSACRRKP